MKNKFLYSLLFLLLFLVLDRLAGTFLEIPRKVLIKDKKYDSYWRWKEFYGLPPNSLDLVFLGSSHCYRSFDPEVFGKSLGLSAMNMGSSAQTPLTSYYVLQEVLRSHKPKYVVIELYWKVLQMNEMSDEFSNATYNFDEMHWNANKLDFFLHAYRPEHFVKLFLISYRYKSNFESAIHYFRGKNISWASGDYYNGKGYVSNANATSTEKLFQTNQFKNEMFEEEKIQVRYLNYLEKIITLCKSQGIQIIFVTSPLPPTSLSMIKGYDRIHIFLLAIAQRHNIPYIDYNDWQYKLDFKDADFKDDDHLNASGVQRLNRNFAERLTTVLSKGAGMPSVLSQWSQP